MKSYKELIVWQKAYQLVLDTYKVSGKFPRREQFSLSLQIKRNVISIVSNIAEGYQRQHTAEYIQFLSIAFGSCAELETQLMLARDLSFLPADDFKRLMDLLEQVGKMLNSLLRKLKLTTSR